MTDELPTRLVPLDTMRLQPSLLASSDGAYLRPRHHTCVCTTRVLDSLRESGSCPAVLDSCPSTTFSSAPDCDSIRFDHAYSPRRSSHATHSIRIGLAFRPRHQLARHTLVTSVSAPRSLQTGLPLS